MAQRILVSLVDDIDGSEATETVNFALDGTAYVIDLNAEHNKELRTALAQYVEVARKAATAAAARGRATPRIRDRRTQATPEPSTTEVRDWAKARGFKINDRGRIPSSIVAEFKARGRTVPPAVPFVAPDPESAPPEPANIKSGPAATANGTAPTGDAAPKRRGGRTKAVTAEPPAPKTTRGGGRGRPKATANAAESA